MVHRGYKMQNAMQNVVAMMQFMAWQMAVPQTRPKQQPAIAANSKAVADRHAALQRMQRLLTIFSCKKSDVAGSSRKRRNFAEFIFSPNSEHSQRNFAEQSESHSGISQRNLTAECSRNLPRPPQDPP